MTPINGLITSAGRLAAESRRVKEAYDGKGAVYAHIAKLFGTSEMHWSRGLTAYQRLVSMVGEDVGVLTASRQQAYRNTLADLNRAVDPDIFPQESNGISATKLGEVALDRLDALHDHLIAVGRSLTVEQEHAQLVSDELDALIKVISSDKHSDIDDFLLKKLKELRFVLDHYTLYGPDGVEDAVGSLVGGLTLRAASGGKLAEPTRKHLKEALTVAKGAMDVLVYANAGAEALAWSGSVAALVFT